MPEIKPRKRLEIIIDTCSMGDKKVRGVNKFIADLKREPRIFEEYRIVIPMQLGTELRQRMFPDFLIKELEAPNKGRDVHLLYKTHTPNIRIVETESSHAFRLYYAKQAIKCLREEPYLRISVLKQAKLLAKKYYPDQPLPISKTSMGSFINAIEKVGEQQEAQYSASLAKLRDYHATSKENNRWLDYQTAKVERKSLARASSQFFEHTSPHRRILMQALYSDSTLYNRVSQVAGFRNFRTDLGERAIEDYLYSRRSETNAANVSLVISEDRGARSSIQRLRGKSNNTIFVIGSYGLAVALKQLHLIDSLFEVMEPELMAQVQHGRIVSAVKKAEGKVATESDINDPNVERKWARRLVEVRRYGAWSESKNKDLPHLPRDRGQGACAR